jgi:hypothetical protein
MSIELDTSQFEKSLAELPEGDPAVVIGFNTNYAAAVHEILTNKHPQGQAKFLEAAVKNAVETGMVEKSIAFQMKTVKTIEGIGPAVARGIERAALQILANAQTLCPIKTGALAASATWQGTDGVGSGKNPNNVKVTARKAGKKATKRQSDGATKGKTTRKKK